MSEEKFIKLTMKRVKKFDEEGKISNDIDGVEISVADKIESNEDIYVPLSKFDKILVGYDSVEHGVSVSLEKK